MVSLLLALALTAFPPPAANRIDLQVGGLMSGPLRAYVDLDGKRAYRGDPPSGQRGDGAGISTNDLPVTYSRELSSSEVESLRAMADAVLKSGVERSPPEQPSVDRIIALEVVSHGKARSGLVYTPNKATERLITAVLLATSPPDQSKPDPQP